MIHNIKDDNFKTEVLENQGPVLVDFYADWCMPCKMLGPVIEKSAEKYDGKIKVCKVNVDEAPQTASTYQIMSIPTLAFFKNGKLENKSMGALTEEKLSTEIEESPSSASLTIALQPGTSLLSCSTISLSIFHPCLFSIFHLSLEW